MKILGDRVRGLWTPPNITNGMPIRQAGRGWCGVAIGKHSEYDGAILVTNRGVFRVQAGCGPVPFFFEEGTAYPTRIMEQEPVPSCDYLELELAEEAWELGVMTGRRAPQPLRLLDEVNAPGPQGIVAWAGVPPKTIITEDTNPDGLVAITTFNSEEFVAVGRLVFFGRSQGDFVFLNGDGANPINWQIRAWRGIRSGIGSVLSDILIGPNILAAQASSSAHVFAQRWDVLDFEISVDDAADAVSNFYVIGFADGEAMLP